MAEYEANMEAWSALHDNNSITRNNLQTGTNALLLLHHGNVCIATIREIVKTIFLSFAQHQCVKQAAGRQSEFLLSVQAMRLNLGACQHYQLSLDTDTPSNPTGKNAWLKSDFAQSFAMATNYSQDIYFAVSLDSDGNRGAAHTPNTDDVEFVERMK